MTEEERVARRMVDAWNARDLDEIVAITDPAIEYVNPPNAIEPGTRRGHDGIVDVARKQWEALAEGDGRLEIESVHERGDSVFMVTVLSWRMPESEARLSSHNLFEMQVVEGKVKLFAIRGTGAEFREAFEDAGLS
jgi:hypothetical protein